MALEYKDYYKILGVQKTATADEIRKAFRKLAREYHPDVAKNKAVAEEKFKEINEAYEVLSDPEKRQKYDSLGADWAQGGQFRPPPGWGGGGGHGGQGHWRSTGGAGAEGFEFEFGGTGFSDFFEQLFGSAGRKRGGFSRAYPGDEEGFSQRGQDVQADLLVSLEEALNGAVRPITLRLNVPCDACHGLGNGCQACHGAGQVSTSRTFQVKIPAGVREGQRLRVPGKGESGTGQGPAGDLYLRVRLEKHPDFRVDGSQLLYDLTLAPWDAVLGAHVTIPTLEGDVNIRIPPGTQAGHKLRVRGRGLKTEGERGDLLVVVHLQVPKAVSAEEKALWEKIKSSSSFHPHSD